MKKTLDFYCITLLESIFMIFLRLFLNNIKSKLACFITFVGHAQNLTASQVAGCLAYGSKLAGSENSPLWYLALKAATAALPTMMN